MFLRTQNCDLRRSERRSARQKRRVLCAAHRTLIGKRLLLLGEFFLGQFAVQQLLQFVFQRRFRFGCVLRIGNKAEGP